MKGVMANVPEHILAWRRKTGADRWDEMWEGVLHMAPSPNRDHQEFEFALHLWLRQHWTRLSGGRVHHQINIAEPGTWPDNYRIPDLVLLTPSRFCIDYNEYFNGGPDVVVEIHSHEDESYDKLNFYAKVGVREVWIVDRDTKQAEIYVLMDDAYDRRTAGPDGWLRSDATQVEMRATTDEKLEIRIAGQEDTRAKLP